MGMTNFAQTMRNWKRMCRYYEELDKDDPCAVCRLHGNNCAAIWEMDDATDWEKLAQLINAWIKEHPIVYPTWWEYLQAYNITGVNIPDSAVIYKLKNWEIPADIAQKLKIEPKKYSAS